MSTFYDVLLDENGDLPAITRHVKGAEAIIQRVRFRLCTFLGEWLLDETAGLPFLEWLAAKNPDLAVIGSRIQREIVETPGVVRIVAFESEFLRDQRLLRFTAEIELETEEVVVVQIFPTGTSSTNATPAVILAGPSGAIFPV